MAPGREYTGAVASEPETAQADVADEAEERQPDPEREARRLVALAPVSYTHLTLPTILRV